VKSPKGFGKKYFVFASILAHSVENKIKALDFTINSFVNCRYNSDEHSNEESPPDDGLLSISDNKPCHCNLVFQLKTALIVKLNIFIPRCPYYTTYFAFRRTGVHPPLQSFI